MVKSGNHSAKIRGVILDYGEVLCFRPHEAHMRRMADIFGVDVQHFAKLYDKNRRAYDRGDLSAEQYWSVFAAETGVQVSSQQLSSLRQWDVEMWSNLNPAMISWIQALKSAGIRTALLSNMQLDMAKKVRAEFSWIKELHTAVLSYELRLAKPEAGIYEHCLRGLGTSPEETLFIDDREVNVEGARKVGLQAISFESPDQLRKELAVLNFAPLPS